MSTFPPRRCLSFPRVSPHRRPFALTVCCTSCLSLFDQPLIALYAFFPLLLLLCMMNVIAFFFPPSPNSISLRGTKRQHVGEQNALKMKPSRVKNAAEARGSIASSTNFEICIKFGMQIA